MDRATWQWLWSRPAKALNTGLVTLLTIGVSASWPALCVVVLLIAVRLCFFVRVLVLSADLRGAAREAVATAGPAPSLLREHAAAGGARVFVQRAETST